jgi:hypothetical protein
MEISGDKEKAMNALNLPTGVKLMKMLPSVALCSSQTERQMK